MGRCLLAPPWNGEVVHRHSIPDSAMLHVEPQMLKASPAAPTRSSASSFDAHRFSFFTARGALFTPTTFTPVPRSSVLTFAPTGTSGLEEASRALAYGCAGHQPSPPRQGSQTPYLKSAMRLIRQSQDFTHCACRTALHVVAVVATLGVTACGSGASAVPTSPGGGPTGDVLAVDVSCPASLLIGERGPCIAVARLRSGQAPLVSFDAIWSSTRPEMVAVDALGVVSGRSAGQAVVSASYRGREGTAPIVVTAEDALRIRAAAGPGEIRPGTTVTMWLQGYYSVASAETGRLSLRISDEAGTITTTSPLTVAKGGDFFLLSGTFVVPQSSAQLCRTAILEVGSVTIAEPTSNASGLWCISVRR